MVRFDPTFVLFAMLAVSVLIYAVFHVARSVEKKKEDDDEYDS